MTMVMISPSEREVSPAEQLRQSPRLVPPRFRLMVAEFRPRRWLVIFFHRKTSYSRRWPPEGHQGAHEAGARPGGRARPQPRGPPVGPTVPIFCNMKSFVRRKIISKLSGRDSAATRRNLGGSNLELR